jgi:hypothetical protein
MMKRVMLGLAGAAAVFVAGCGDMGAEDSPEEQADETKTVAGCATRSGGTSTTGLAEQQAKEAGFEFAVGNGTVIITNFRGRGMSASPPKLAAFRLLLSMGVQMKADSMEPDRGRFRTRACVA